MAKLEIKVESKWSYCLSGKIGCIQAMVGQFKTQARAFMHMHFNTLSHIIHSQTEIASMNVNYKKIYYLKILSNHCYTTMKSIQNLINIINYSFINYNRLSSNITTAGNLTLLDKKV